MEKRVGTLYFPTSAGEIWEKVARRPQLLRREGKEYIWSERGGWVEAPYGCLTSVGPLIVDQPPFQSRRVDGRGRVRLGRERHFLSHFPPFLVRRTHRIFILPENGGGNRGRPTSINLTFFCPAAGQEGERKVCKMGNANAAKRNGK